MKKIFTLLVALISITTLFAQSGRYSPYSDKRNSSEQSRNYDQGNQRYDNSNYSQEHQRSYNGGYNIDRSHNEGFNNDRNRGYDVRDNRSYDVRDNRDYRSHNTYGREYDRRNERSGNALGAVGAGLIVGGIIAIIAGSHQ